MSEQQRREKMPDLRKEHKRAKQMIYDRMADKYLDRISDCETAYQIFSRLDDQFLGKSKVRLVMLYTRWRNLVFKEPGDMNSFVLKHEAIVADIIRYREKLTEERKVIELHLALTAKYDSVFQFWANLPEKNQTYEAYRNMLLETHDRLVRLHHNQRRGQTRTENRETKSEGKIICFKCAEPGHVASQCGSKSGKSGGETSQEKGLSNDQKKPDWTKSKINPKDANRTSIAMSAFIDEESQETLDQKIEEREKRRLFQSANTYDDPVFEHAMVSEITDNQEKEDDETNRMMIDSGAGKHMTYQYELLLYVEALDNQIMIKCAERNALMFGTHIGDIHMCVRNRNYEKKIITLKNVIYVPKISHNLFSVNQATADDLFEVSFRKLYVDIKCVESGDVIFSGYTFNRMKWFDFSHVRTYEEANVARIILTDQDWQLINLWHRRFGHIGAQNLQTVCNLVEGMPKLYVPHNAFKSCKVCIEAKAHRKAHNREHQKPNRKFLEIHSDILDPLVEANGGFKYVISFIDAFSGHVIAEPIRRKSEAAMTFAKIHKWLGNRFPEHPVAILKPDNAPEYTAGDMEDYCTAAGVKIDAGEPYNPELHGTAEHMNKILLERMRALLNDAGISLQQWPLALKVAEYIINRSPTKRNVNQKTPYEMIYDEKPNVTNMRVFGTVGLVHIPKEVRSRAETKKKRRGDDELINEAKLGKRTNEKIFVGYTTTGWKMFDMFSKTIVPSCDVTFFEDQTHEMHLLKLLKEQNVLEVENTSEIENNIPIQEIPEITICQAEMRVTDEELTRMGEYVMASVAIQNFPTNFRKEERRLSDYIPRTYKQAIECKYAQAWMDAVNREFDSHQFHETWTLVDYPSGKKNVLSTKWIFLIKIKEEGEETAKARLVALGNNDKN